MRAKHVRNSDEKRPERNGLFSEFGARIARSLFVWGLAAVLAFSAYMGFGRIAKQRKPPENTPISLTDGQGCEYTETSAPGGQGGEYTETSAPDGQGGEYTEISSPGGSGSEYAEAAAMTGTVEKSAGMPSGQPDERKQGTRSDPAERRRVALTFDDGPHPVCTKELLDGLKERGVKATFFVIGENIPGNEDLIRRMDEEGHLIGNHTYDHVKISDMSKADACRQIERTSALIRELIGKDTEFVRPPFGEWNKELECSFVMIPVLWDVDPKDWTTGNVSDVVRRVLEDTENGDIILLHDCYSSSVQAALQIVDELQGQGYEFVTVDQLILE